MTSGIGAVGRLAEFFTLQRAGGVSARLSETDRRKIADALALGRQKADAADSLWANGHSAEALRLGVESLDATVGALEPYALAMKLAPLGPPPMPTVVAAEKEGPGPGSEPTSGVGSESTEGEPGSAGEPAASDLHAAREPAAAAVEATRDAAGTGDAAPGSDERAIRAAALRDRGAGAEEIGRHEATLDAARALALPRFDADVTPAQMELYQQIVHARHAIDRRLATAAYVRRELAMTRAARIGTALLVVAGVVGATHFATRRPEYTVHASEVWADFPAHDEQKAVDDRTDTWWLLPDGHTGWLEVRFTEPRDIHHVRLMNTVNAPHMDRGTHEYRVELYANGRLARTIDGSFEYTTSPDWVTHDAQVEDVQRIRFVVESHHRTSAGLTELDWD